jgi:transposase
MFTWRYLIRLLANARKVQLTYGKGRKTDKIDAEKLARLAQLDPELLSPIKHRGESSQCRLALLHSRAALVGTSTKLITHVRSTVKSVRARLPKARRKAFTTSLPSTCRRTGTGYGSGSGDHRVI